ncbi:MAG: hypothetical protein U1E89_22300 [Burkholderiaceae bacterium]
MSPGAFAELQQRVHRCTELVHKKTGGGSEATYVIGGVDHVVRISGAKSTEQLKDEILNLYVWIWSIKDHLKELCRRRGVDPQRIERIADSEPSLTIAADIANQAKHGELKSSRSGRFPRLSVVGLEFPGASIQHISAEAQRVEVNIGLPESAIIHAQISFTDGTPTLDALINAEQAIHAWQTRAFPLAGV